MDKSKKYRIVNTLTSIGEIADSAKHRIGREGKFIRLKENMRFEFLYDSNDDSSLMSSTVLKIEESDELLRVHTLNTIYEFVLAE